MIMSAGAESTRSAARTASGSLTSPLWIVRLVERREGERPAVERMVVSLEGVRTTGGGLEEKGLRRMGGAGTNGPSSDSWLSERRLEPRCIHHLLHRRLRALVLGSRMLMSTFCFLAAEALEIGSAFCPACSSVPSSYYYLVIVNLRK